MSKEEQLLEYWQDLTVEQQEEVINFLKTLKHKAIAPPISPLGQRLLAIRQKIVATGVPLLNWDDLVAEVADRRGGTATQDL